MTEKKQRVAQRYREEEEEKREKQKKWKQDQVVDMLWCVRWESQRR